MVDPKDLIRALRQRLGMTQERFAEATSMLAREEVVKLESGKNQASSLRVIEAIANAAGASLDDIAAYFHGRIDVDELLRRAEAFQQPERMELSARDEAADIARRGGIDPAAIASVLAEPLPARKFSTLEWIEMIRLREITLRREAKG